MVLKGTHKLVKFILLEFKKIGLETPPYGLCLLISASIGGMDFIKVLKEVFIILLANASYLITDHCIPRNSIVAS